MIIDSKNFRLSLRIAAILAALLAQAQTTGAQEEVASGLRRFDRFLESGYYEEHEVLPRNQRPNVAIPGVRRDIFPYSPTAAEVRIRTRLADSHIGLKFYNRRQCWDCHQNEAMNNHSINAGITCRQCHGGEPVAGIYHYYSPLNPIRRHAYVCAKCHEGAGASFATYLVHEPKAGSKDAKMSFPGLYYVSWFMVILLIGTLGFFVPHTVLLGLRELFRRKRKSGL